MIHERFTEGPDHGGTIRGDVRIAEGPPPRSALVVAHGFKGFKDWGFFPWLCRSLAAAGHAVVSFNFSGSGVGTRPTELTELEAFAANTFSREQEDLRWVLARLRGGELTPRKPDRVGLLGHSRGGAAAVLTAVSEARVDALVTWSAVATFDRWSEETKAEWRREGRVHVLNSRTGQHLPLDVGLLEDFERNREALDVRRAAGRVDAPWLIVHGADDVSVDSEDARALARANPDAKLHLVEGAGHTFGAGHPFEGPPAALEEAFRVSREHFARHLEA